MKIRYLILIVIFLFSEMASAKIATRMRKTRKIAASNVILGLAEGVPSGMVSYEFLLILTNSGSTTSAGITYNIPKFIGHALPGTIMGFYVSYTDCTTLAPAASCSIEISYDDGGVQNFGCFTTNDPFYAYSGITQSNLFSLAINVGGGCGGGEEM